jgi:hypothetical protein
MPSMLKQYSCDSIRRPSTIRTVPQPLPSVRSWMLKPHSTLPDSARQTTLHQSLTPPHPTCQTTFQLSLHRLPVRTKEVAIRKNNIPPLTSMEPLRRAQVRVRHIFLTLETSILRIERHIRNRGAFDVKGIVVVVAPHNSITIVASCADALSLLHDAAVDLV